MSEALKALSSVYEQALAESRKLLQRAADHYNEAVCDDPERLAQILDARDDIIDKLAALDEQASVLLQGLSGNGQALPESLQILREEVQKNLSEVRMQDEAFARIIEKNLETLKSLTLKARGVGRLTRSMGTMAPESGKTIDYTR